MTKRLNGLQLSVLRSFAGTGDKTKPALIARNVPNAFTATINKLSLLGYLQNAVWAKHALDCTFRITAAGEQALIDHSAATAPKRATEDGPPTIANGHWYPSRFMVFAEWPAHRAQLYSGGQSLRIDTYEEAVKVVRRHAANWKGDVPAYAIFETSHVARTVPAEDADGAPIYRNGNAKNPNLRKG